MKGSIEEQILQMQQKKLELVQTAIGNKNVTGEPIGIYFDILDLYLFYFINCYIGNFKLRLEDLQQLFGGGGN